MKIWGIEGLFGLLMKIRGSFGLSSWDFLVVFVGVFTRKDHEKWAKIGRKCGVFQGRENQNVGYQIDTKLARMALFSGKIPTNDFL